jgi:hypothetical protein
LKLTLQELRHSSGQPLADCLQTEFQIAAHILRGHDFYEGVRAVVIDKDQRPAWQPGSLAAFMLNNKGETYDHGAHQKIDENHLLAHQ